MSEYTAVLNGVTIGGASPYRWAVVPTGLGHGAMQTASLQRPSTDGIQVLGVDTVSARQITFDLWWDAATPAGCEQLARALAAAWRPQRSGVIPMELSVVDTDYILFGRPRSFELDLSTVYNGHARARAVFEATDPRLFSLALSSVVLGLNVGGGMTFPLTFPLTFGAGSDSDGVAVNTGTFETTWTATIVGPVTTPRITLAATGQFVEFDGTIPAGSTLTVSQTDGAVVLDGSPRQSWVTLPSRFFTLPPGSSTIRFRAASGTGSCTFSWRSAWL